MTFKERRARARMEEAIERERARAQPLNKASSTTRYLVQDKIVGARRVTVLGIVRAHGSGGLSLQA